MNENIIEHKELVKSNIATLYDVDLSQFEKGGVGSGRKIGTTTSGKSVYANSEMAHENGHYSDFTKEDHEDAVKLHQKRWEKFGNKQKYPGDEHSNNSHKALSQLQYHTNILRGVDKYGNKLQKSQIEDIIEKGQASDAFRYSDSQAFKIDLTGAEIKEKCKIAIPYLIAQKNALKEIAQDALNQCDGIAPDDTRKDGLTTYAVFSYDLKEPKRDQYTNTYPERSDCQVQMDRYNSAIYQMLDINSDIKVLQTLTSALNDDKTYQLSLNQIVAISMGYTEDEFAEKAIEVEIEKGGEGSRGGKIIGHTKSGKPVYANKNATHKDYSNFTEQDHKDAIKLHDNLSGEYDIKNSKSISSKDKAEFIKNRDNHADKVESHIKKTGKKYSELFKN